ncbi:MAG: MerR family transcriptional regulator [Candidatus Acidiferrales bacterium]
MAAERNNAGIPDKPYFRIGEVSRLTATKAFVLRYWETEFPMLQPIKSSKGQRLYRRQDIETVLVIKRLLYNEGFTIAGARRYLREQNGNDGGAMQLTGATLASAEQSRGAPARQPLEARPSKRARNKLTAVRDELLAILTLLDRK